MAESNSYTGNISSTRSTYQTLTSQDLYSKTIQWACFNKTPFTKALGVEGFGVEGMSDIQAFGKAQPTGRMIRMDSGVYGLRASLWDTSGTSFHVGRLGNFTPELVEGGDEWAYSWHRMVQVQFIPDVDVQDNTKGLINIKLQKQEGMKQKFVQDFNYSVLGNSSAPDSGTMGPSAVYTDLPNLISVTQSRSVGAITKASGGAWANGVKQITDIGGGGDLDRPLALRRSLLDALNDQMVYAEASNDYLCLATQGAWQIYDRLMYADSIQGGRSGAFGVKAKYDAAGIPNFALDGNPMVWDPAVTVPYGATASTEAIYGIHIPTFFVSIRSEENFKLSDWEQPREHDVQKTLVCSLKLRYTPMVTAMRPHWVAYDIPACAD